MTPRFMTAKGAGLASGQSYYIGHVQHEKLGVKPQKDWQFNCLIARFAG